MPLRPDLTGHEASPHVLRYANRVARLRRGGVFEETVMWDRGAFEHFGEVLAAEWLTETDAQEARASVFGV